MTTKEREEAINEFVIREILADQSELIIAVLTQHIFSVDDIENIYRPFDGKLLTPAICIWCKDSFGCLDSETGECEECFERNQTPQKISGWWLVSPWFGKQLLLRGEPVLENDYGIWWGRTTTGQAVSKDYIIQQIYDDLMT